VTERRSDLLPALAASFACICGGMAIVASRIAIAESDSYALTVLRQLGGMLWVSLAAALAYGRQFRVARGDWLPLIGLAILQYVGFAWFVTASVAYIPAARAALLLTTMPLATLAIAAAIGQERASALKVAGCVLGLIGVAIARGEEAGASAADAWKGDLLMLGGIIAGSLHAVLSAPLLRRYSAARAGGLQLLVGLACLIVLLLAFGDPAHLVSFSARGWTAILWLTLAGWPAFFFWMWALAHTTPSRVMVTIAFNPIMAAILAAYLVDEKITAQLVLGLTAVVLGIALAYWPARERTERALAD
jgi:drug/metabolite transporter (DMT)-like permease